MESFPGRGLHFSIGGGGVFQTWGTPWEASILMGNLAREYIPVDVSKAYSTMVC